MAPPEDASPGTRKKYRQHNYYIRKKEVMVKNDADVEEAHPRNDETDARRSTADAGRQQTQKRSKKGKPKGRANKPATKFNVGAKVGGPPS